MPTLIATFMTLVLRLMQYTHTHTHTHTQFTKFVNSFINPYFGKY
jgi:hypothetical protein